MVEAGSNLKLLPASILDIYKVFEHNAMLSINIQQQPSLTLTHFTHCLIGSDFGVRGHLWSQNDVIMSWMRLTATSNCFPHVYLTYRKCLSTLICCPFADSSRLTQLYPPLLGSDFEVRGRLWSQNDVIMS